jgi:tRNA(Ile)-lysidine synthase
MSLLNNLHHFLIEQVPDTHIALGYSGGLDSTVLLHMLVELKNQRADLNIQAIHVHHGLSKNADSWVEHCRKTCLELDVDFNVAYAELKLSNRSSIEQLAREARYGLLDKVSKENAVLLTAQHQDDQAETLLLQLMRGAGPKGLSGMSMSDRLASGRALLRPLLSVTRAELEGYAKSHQLSWIEDESNTDNRFDRNFLRNRLMPLLNERWPNATKTISRSAALCDDQQRLIEAEAHQKLQSALYDDKEHNDRLKLDVLKGMTPSWFNQVLRLWLRKWQVELPSVSVMTQIYQQTVNGRGDAQVNIQLSGAQIRRYDKSLYLLNNDDVQILSQANESIVWDVRERLLLSHLNQAYYLEKSEHGFSWQPGDNITVEFGHLTAKFKCQSNRPSKIAKQWFKEWKIPPWERQNIPFFYCDSKLVQIGDRVNLLSRSRKGTDTCVIKRELQ